MMNYPDIEYKELDGRGDNEGFQNCVLDAFEELTPTQGLHIIKEFEPMPLYALLEKKGYSKYVKEISKDEYHAWFYPNKENVMKEYLNLDEES